MYLERKRHGGFTVGSDLAHHPSEPRAPGAAPVLAKARFHGRGSTPMTPRENNDARRPGARTGFGLVEALMAIVVFSIGVIGVAAATSGIAAQEDLGLWSTDQGLLAQGARANLARSGFAALSSARLAISLGPRSYDVTRTVTPSAPGLKEVRLVIRDALGRTSSLRTRVAAARPLPVAP